MPDKNKGGIGMFLLPKRGKKHHKQHETHNNRNDKRHSAFGNSHSKPQQIPMISTEEKSESTVAKPVLITANIPLEPIPSTSTSSDKITENKVEEPNDAIVSADDEVTNIDAEDSVDGEKDGKQKDDKEKDGKKDKIEKKQDNDDDEPEQGCGFTCLAITVDICGCVIS